MDELGNDHGIAPRDQEEITVFHLVDLGHKLHRKLLSCLSRHIGLELYVLALKPSCELSHDFFFVWLLVQLLQFSAQFCLEIGSCSNGHLSEAVDAALLEQFWVLRVETFDLVRSAFGNPSHHRFDVRLGEDLPLGRFYCGDDPRIAIEFLLHCLLYEKLLVYKPIKDLSLGWLLLSFGYVSNT